MNLATKPHTVERCVKSELISQVSTPPTPPDLAPGPWTPLIVVGNRTAGHNDGETVLNAFRGILNPAQVRGICEMLAVFGYFLFHSRPDCRLDS